MKNKIFVIIIFLGLSSFLESDELLDKYIDDAKSSYVLKDYEKAYSRMKFIVKYYNYSNDKIPQEIRSLSENIYFEYIKKLYNEKKNETLTDIYKNDPYYASLEKNSSKIRDYRSSIESERLKREQEDEFSKKMSDERKRLEEEAKIKRERELELEKLKIEKEDAYNKELEKLKKEQEALLKKKNDEDKVKEEKFQIQVNRQLAESRRKEIQLEAQREKEKKELQEMQNKLTEERIAAERKIKEEVTGYFDKIIMAKNNDSSSIGKTIILIVALIVGVFGLIFLVVFGIVILFMRNTHVQQQRYFEYSMRLIQQQPLTNILSIPMPMPPAASDHLIEENNVKKIGGPAIIGDPNMEKLKKIMETCNAYAVEIDQVTHRKNCSKNVADLVYKISKHFGYSEFDSLVYYSAALIYDIGFLSIDSHILAKEDLSEEEYEVIKTHTNLGLNMIHFIDNDLRSIYIDAISKHHENLDGTGYPVGLKQHDIPYIARVIRVVETFISLISVRKYKKITDKESAIKILLENKKKYDKKIIDALNGLV